MSLTTKGGASRRAKQYGHKLTRWRPMTTMPDGAVAECENCGARVYFDPQPGPAFRPVYGPAVDYRCPDQRR